MKENEDYFIIKQDNNVSYFYMPQKKGFLLGDQARYDEDPTEYGYNLNIKVSFGYCTFTNLEDRLPKTRGGMIYLYNCVADSSLYYKVRSIILKKKINLQT